MGNHWKNMVPVDLRTGAELKKFWSKVDTEGPCWYWRGTINENGYGIFSLRYRTTLAHRVSFRLANGSIDDTLVIDHICGKTMCVNPAHLRQVTLEENSRVGRKSNRDKRECPKCHGPYQLYVGKKTYRFCPKCSRERVNINNKRIAALKRAKALQNE